MGVTMATMLAFSRFRVPQHDAVSFQERAREAVAFFSGREGCLAAELLRNLDDPELWTIVSRWISTGSYRRAFNGYDAKVVLVPLLSEAIDEPSAYAGPDEVGENRPRGTLT